MDDRVQRYLDGELPFGALEPDERAEARGLESLYGRVVAEVGTDAPDLTEAVMARIAERAPMATGDAGRSPVAAALRWLWAPRSLQIAWRPAFALVGAALALALLWAMPSGQPEASVPGADPSPQILVQFRLDAPDASSVALAGDFTGWQPSHELRRNGRGVWSIVVPLDPGIHDYAFVVDGERWTPDPLAMQVDDGFGGRNSRFSLLTPSGRSS